MKAASPEFRINVKLGTDEYPQREALDPSALAESFGATAGVVQHGLFPPALTSEVLVARGGKVDRTTY